MIADIVGSGSKTSRESLTFVRSRVLAKTPPFRPVAVQLMRLVGDSTLSLFRIVELLRTDAVLTASVMRLVNSPLFGSRYEIKNILQALSFLGMDRIRDQIVTIAMRGLVDEGPEVLIRDCWRHNLATALVCQRLSASAGLPPNTCYIAGLVHDIGRLALLRTFPRYTEEMTVALANGKDLLTAERDLFAADHAEVGRWLLAQWGCPIELQNVAALHENPPVKPSCDRALIVMVWAGSHVADLMGMSACMLDSPGDLTEIAFQLCEEARRELLTKYQEIADGVAMNVNEIELSLG